MFRSLTIRNFRCFPELTVTGLRRVNVLVGKNGSGKTTLLESIFLATGGGPEIALRFRPFRGMGMGLAVEREQVASLFRDLFSSYDFGRTISIELLGEGNRSVKIFRTNESSLTLPLAKDAVAQASSSVPLNFVWRLADGSERTVQPEAGPNGLSFPQVPLETGVVFLPAHFSLSPEETATRFSDEVSKRGEKTFFLRGVQEVFPEVRDISSEKNAGTWMLHVAVEPLKGMMVPSALHSAGINHLLAILCAIAASPNGLVLVDEIENGLHYSVLGQAWRLVFEFAVRYDCQVFATTHSKECLEAAVSSMGEHDAEFSLLRTSRTPEGIRTEQFEGKRFVAALESGFEIR